ncbi:hypothetical protein PMAYCL1PPCAC_00088, partial [Pristionchus mayeri]
KEKEETLFNQTREDDDDGLDYDEVSLKDSFFPLMKSLVDRTLSESLGHIQAMTELTAKKEAIHQPPIQPTGTSVHSQSASHSQAQIPLPPLRIEPFDGSNITLWSSFHSQFQTIIGNRAELSNLEKLNYLRSSLTGDAFTLVQSIPIRDDLYTHTLDRLKVAYDRSNHSTAVLYHKLMTLMPKSQSTEDQLSCVRDMINLVYHINDDNNLNSLPFIGQLASHVNAAFVRKIWKLSPRTMMDALTFIDKELREELEFRAIESAFAHHSVSSHFPSTTNPRSSTTENHSKSPDGAHTDHPKCEYCKSNHSSINCSKYKTYEERSTRISQMKVCRRCLKSDHLYSQCRLKCAKCNEKHHESICQSTFSPQRSTENDIRNHSFPSPFTIPRLQTTTGVIRNPAQGTACDATVFLDSGSQISMITRSLSDKLNLEPFDCRLIQVAGANGVTSPEPFDIVHFDIMTNKGVQSVTACVANEFPFNTLKVDAVPLEDVKFMKEMAITVPPHSITSHTVHPEILLGVDVTHSLTMNTVSTKLPSGLDLMHSHLGPIIFGTQIIADLHDPDDQSECDARLEKFARIMFTIDETTDYDE